MKKNKRKKWTNEEISLLHFLSNFVNDFTLAKILGRTRMSIAKLRKREDLNKKKLRNTRFKPPIIIVKPKSYYKTDDLLISDYLESDIEYE